MKMTEKELIGGIRKLRQIKPRKDWVYLTKSQILGEGKEKIELTPFLTPFFPFFRPAYAGLIVVFVLFGLFGISQNSLPGDLLYPIKKITEKSQAVFVSEEEKPNFQLKLTSERLEELSKIVEANQVGKLSSALKEFNTTKVEAKKELAKTIQTKSEEEAIKIAKKVAPELKEIQEKEGEVLASLGLEPEEEAGTPAEKIVVELLLKDLENATLNEEEQGLLTEAKADYEKGDYWQALEKILQL